MREMIKLLAVVLIFSAVSGGLLAALHGGTLERIEYQELLYVRCFSSCVFSAAQNVSKWVGKFVCKIAGKVLK